MTLHNIDRIDLNPFMRFVVALFASIFAIFVIIYFTFYRVLNREKGNERMIYIANEIKTGARAFLNKEYTYLSVYVIVFYIVVSAVTDDWEKLGLSFLLGAFLSALCGYLGMSIAVEANVRTAQAASKGLNPALEVAFASGGVMGLCVVCCGLLGLILVYAIWGGIDQDDTKYLAGFGFGGSSIALFARVGGGIYTKAADVGADLVGKVEAGIPEDDPRNPAVIADNVGDNVGDIAGMGADLFESYVGSIIASIQLADSALFDLVEKDETLTLDDIDYAKKAFIALPFWITGFGVISAIIGIFAIRTGGTVDPRTVQSVLLSTIRTGLGVAAFLGWVLSYVSCGVLFGFDNVVTFKLWGCITIGLVAGQLIGYSTEYATSFSYKPTQSIAKKSRISSATVVIQGIGIGMLSTVAPLIVLFATTLACFALAGSYGIAITTVGMLSTLGVTLATDAFGPVADNAGGIAEMSHLDASVRETTDALDALGNTTAATGKGFAIGSAVLTALALISAYKTESKITQIDVSDSAVLASVLFGACLPYVFAALTMMAVGRAASLMIEEVRRQFRELDLLNPNNTNPPDTQRCVEISTYASILEMIVPSCLIVLAPLFIGYLLGAEALGGMLIGSVSSAFMLAVFMANAGGAWDNAKKFIEANGLAGHGKGSEAHKAAVVGDTIGDPFKDTSGPSLNILIKLNTMLSLVFGSSFKHEAFHKDRWWIALIIAVIFLTIMTGLFSWMRMKGIGRINFDPKLTENEHDSQVELKKPVGSSSPPPPEGEKTD